MIALGIGQHNWDTSTCIAQYHYIVANGFEEKLFTKSRILGWIARWFRESIYVTKNLEDSLRAAYGSRNFFGLLPKQGFPHSTRVAVTTTVDSEPKLIANYNSGDKNEYLNSSSSSWEM